MTASVVCPDIGRYAHLGRSRAAVGDAAPIGAAAFG
jgi:hypothetical protein